jgi:hypothetical protein
MAAGVHDQVIRALKFREEFPREWLRYLALCLITRFLCNCSGQPLPVPQPQRLPTSVRSPSAIHG